MILLSMNNKFFLFKNKYIFFSAIFLFFLFIIFWNFKALFHSYFEADEWFHFTYYFPLTTKPDGWITALTSTFTNSGALSGGQHVVPIAALIFFLNTKFFGLYYPPYAFMSLFFHAVNSFLIFVLIYVYLQKNTKRFYFALMGSVFFALSPTPLHTITGAAPFYGQNILSVTFFILCLIAFKYAFIKKEIKFVYISIVFIFLSLFTKETSVFLFVLLPFIAFFEKRIFSWKLIGKIFTISIIFYIFLRFLVPQIFIWTNIYGSVDKSSQTKIVKTETIVSNDNSIYENLPLEIIFRSITYPLKMMTTVFFPRQTIADVVKFITPVMVPIPPGGDITPQLIFLYGSGNFFIIYLISILLLFFFFRQGNKLLKQKDNAEGQMLILGLIIIILSSLPLVAIIFAFPRWGYDFYFDSRFYYNPTVGAALLFPFLVFKLAQITAQLLRRVPVLPVAVCLFIIWLIYNFQILHLAKDQFINKYSSDRREVVEQLTKLLPKLLQKTVFYFETDNQSAYGPTLPFQTSIPQALTLVYFDKNRLPDSFFNTLVLKGKSEGYQFANDRGFGYYTSKKKLTEDLSLNKFSVDDIRAYYYYAKKVKLIDNTSEIKKELQQ